MVGVLDYDLTMARYQDHEGKILDGSAAKPLMIAKNAESAFLWPKSGWNLQCKKTAVHGHTNRSVTKKPVMTAQISIPHRTMRLFLAFTSILPGVRSEMVDFGPCQGRSEFQPQASPSRLGMNEDCKEGERLPGPKNGVSSKRFI